MSENYLVSKILGSARHFTLFVLLVVLFFATGIGIAYVLASLNEKPNILPAQPGIVNQETELGEGANQKLTVNAQLQVKGQFYLAPTTVPSTAEAGTLIFDQATSTLQYYNGTSFVPLTAQQPGSQGGVTSLQGQTGAVTLTPGSGVSINGTTIANSGILGINGVAGDINVTTANGVATLSLPQSVAPSANPTFNGLTLSTALPVSSGGTGSASLTANGVLVGNGTGAISSVTAGMAGQCLVSTAGAPVFGACSGGSVVNSLNGLTGALTLANATGVGTTVTIDDATTAAKGIASFNSTNFSVASGAVNTIQNIATSSSPTFAGLTLTSALTVGNGGTGSTTAAGARSNLGAAASGANGDITSLTALTAITPGAALTVGSSTQQLTLQGSALSTLTATSGANTTTVGFVTPTANATINFPALTAGTYQLCTTSGNCLGAGGGANASLSNLSAVAINTALLPGSTTIDLGSTANPFRDLYIGGAATNNFRLTGTATASRTITFPDATGTVCLTTGNCAGIGGTGDILQNGNSFTAAMTIGTNDNFDLNLETNGTARVTINNSGDVSVVNNLSVGATLKLGSYTQGTLPVAAAAGRIVTLSDGSRGVWMDQGLQWFSLTGEVVNVKEFGARGDGTTNDTAALNAALSAGAGRSVYLPPGTYMHTGLTLPSQVYVYGHGESSILRLMNSSNTYNLARTSANNGIRLENFAIDGNKANQTEGSSSRGVYLVDATRAIIKDLYIYNVEDHGIHLSQSGAQTGNIIEGNVISGAGKGNSSVGGSGIAITSGLNDTISNNAVLDSWRAGIRPSGTGIVVSGNTIKGNGNGGIVPVSGATTDITISGNTIADNYNAGGTSPTEHSGVRLVGIDNFVVTGNNIYRNGGSGVDVLNGSDNGVISGNVCRANAQSGTGSGIRIYSTGSAPTQINITGNRCFDDQGTQTQQYGLSIENNASSINFADNMLSGNLTGDLNITTSGTGITGTSAPATDTFAVTTTRTERLRVTDTGMVGIGTTGPDARLELAGNISAAAWGLNGIQLQAAAATYNDTSTAASGTAANAVFNSFAQPVLAATNTGVTTTNAATVYIQNSPAAGTNQTITNAYALWVDNGTVRLDGDLQANGDIALGDSGVDTLTVNASVLGANALVFEGATANAFETTIAITDPAADRTITLPDETGTICTNAAGGACATSSTGFYQNGGNNFGGTGTLGLTSNNDLNVLTNNATRLTVQADGDIDFDTSSLFVDATNNSVGIGIAAPNSVLNVYQADPILTIQDTDTGITTAQAWIRFAESGASSTVDNYWQAGASAVNSAFDFIIQSNSFSNVLTANRSSGNIALGALPSSARLAIGGNGSQAAWGTNGIQLRVGAQTYTDTSTAASGTATNAAFNSFAQPTLAATNTGVTTTNAATVYIQNSPVAGANQTITNAYALWVDDGAVRLDGALGVGGQLTVGTADTTGTLLLLDTKTDTGDPAGAEGGMYYNDFSNKFRCYENTGWADCITSPGGLFTDAGTYAYLTATTDSINFGGTTDLSAKVQIVGTSDQEQLLIRAHSGQTDDNPLMLFQNSAGTEIARFYANANNNLFLGEAAGGTTQSGNLENIGIGTGALDELTNGDENVAIGTNSLGTNTTGTGNVALGYLALEQNGAGVDNIAIGRLAMQGSEGGGDNIAIGYSALLSATGSSNIAIGASALSLATGSNNIAIGFNTGDNITTGAGNLIIGYNLDASAAGVDDQFRLGSGTNVMMQGDLSTNALQFNGVITFAGDLLPSTASARDIGSTTLEFDDIYLGDNNGLRLGLDQDALLAYDQLTDNRVELVGTGASLFIEDTLAYGVQTLTLTDDGTANDTLTPTATYVRVDVNETANAGVPNIVFSETGAKDGQLLIIVNNELDGSHDTFTINDSAGVVNWTATTIGAEDAATFIYMNDRWVGIAGSNN